VDRGGSTVLSGKLIWVTHHLLVFLSCLRNPRILLNFDPTRGFHCFPDELNMRYGLGWLYGLRDEFAKVNTKIDTRRSVILSEGLAGVDLGGKPLTIGGGTPSAALTRVWPAISGLYLPPSGSRSRSDVLGEPADRDLQYGPENVPKGYNALDLDLYLTSRTFAVLDAALFGYVDATGITGELDGGRSGGGAGANPTPCGHIGARG